MPQNRLSGFAQALKTQILSQTASADRPTKTQITLWVLILVSMVTISLGHYHLYQLGTHFDDSVYVVLARSLLHSHTYGMINVPGQPLAGKYPFGYPLLLVPSMVLFPNSLDALKIPSLIATILNTTILFWGWRWFYKPNSYWWGLAVSGLYALAPMTIDHTRRVMSEPVFTFFCLLAILLAEQYARGRKIRGWTTAMSIVLLFVTFTRSIGALLVVVVIGYLFLKKRFDFSKDLVRVLIQLAALICLVVIITPVQWKDLIPVEYLGDENARFIVALFSRNQSDQSGIPSLPIGSVLQPGTIIATKKPSSMQILLFYGIKQHLGKDLRTVAFPIGGGTREQNLANRIGFPTLPLIFGYFITGIIILGFFLLLKREISSLFLLFGLLYFIVIFFWMWDDPRLLYPIQPQISLSLLTGIEAIWLWISHSFHRKYPSETLVNLIFASLVTILILISAYKSTLIEDSRIHAGDLQVRSNWLVANSAPTAILMTEAPETDYIYSGRNTISYPSNVSDADNLERYLLSNRINFVLVAPIIEWRDSYKPILSDQAKRLLPLLEQLSLSNRLRQVYLSAQDNISVFQVLP